MITDHRGPTRPGFGRLTTRSNAARTLLTYFRFPATEYTLLEQSFKQDHALHQRTIFLSMFSHTSLRIFAPAEGGCCVLLQNARLSLWKSGVLAHARPQCSGGNKKPSSKLEVSEGGERGYFWTFLPSMQVSRRSY